MMKSISGSLQSEIFPRFQIQKYIIDPIGKLNAVVSHINLDSSVIVDADELTCGNKFTELFLIPLDLNATSLISLWEYYSIIKLINDWELFLKKRLFWVLELKLGNQVLHEYRSKLRNLFFFFSFQTFRRLLISKLQDEFENRTRNVESKSKVMSFELYFEMLLHIATFQAENQQQVRLFKPQ